MTSSLSAQGQLLAGLETTLYVGLAGLVAPTDGVRLQWPRDDLVARVQDGSLAIFPFVVIQVGDETVATGTGTATAGGGATDLLGPADSNGVATQLVETARYQCPVTFTIVGAGERGPDVVDSIKTRLRDVVLRRSPGARLILKGAVGGTFTLSVGAKTTAALAYNATPTAIAAALTTAQITAAVAGVVGTAGTGITADSRYSVMPSGADALQYVTADGSNLQFDATLGGSFAVEQVGGYLARDVTPGFVVALPDDTETGHFTAPTQPGVVPGPLYGITARLFDLGAHTDWSEAPRDLYRTDLRMRALYTEYRRQTVTLATGGVIFRGTIATNVVVTLTP